jgi:hypothetical protein
MNDHAQPLEQGNEKPANPCAVETEFLNCHYVCVDAVGDTTVRPANSPLFRQLRPDQPPPPLPTDDEK